MSSGGYSSSSPPAPYSQSPYPTSQHQDVLPSQEPAPAAKPRITMVGAIAIGVGVAATAFVARAFLVGRTRGAAGMRSFYKGGFEAKMNRKEAALILGMPERGISKDLIRKKHRQMMLMNHPDRGGSPYLATKINEAKEFLDKTG